MKKMKKVLTYSSPLAIAIATSVLAVSASDNTGVSVNTNTNVQSSKYVLFDFEITRGTDHDYDWVESPIVPYLEIDNVPLFDVKKQTNLLFNVNDVVFESRIPIEGFSFDQTKITNGLTGIALNDYFEVDNTNGPNGSGNPSDSNNKTKIYKWEKPTIVSAMYDANTHTVKVKLTTKVSDAYKKAFNNYYGNKQELQANLELMKRIGGDLFPFYELPNNINEVNINDYLTSKNFDSSDSYNRFYPYNDKDSSEINKWNQEFLKILQTNYVSIYGDQANRFGPGSSTREDDYSTLALKLQILLNQVKTKISSVLVGKNNAKLNLLVRNLNYVPLTIFRQVQQARKDYASLYNSSLSDIADLTVGNRWNANVVYNLMKVTNPNNNTSFSFAKFRRLVTDAVVRNNLLSKMLDVQKLALDNYKTSALYTHATNKEQFDAILDNSFKYIQKGVNNTRGTDLAATADLKEIEKIYEEVKNSIYILENDFSSQIKQIGLLKNIDESVKTNALNYIEQNYDEINENKIVSNKYFNNILEYNKLSRNLEELLNFINKNVKHSFIYLNGADNINDLNEAIDSVLLAKDLIKTNFTKDLDANEIVTVLGTQDAYNDNRTYIERLKILTNNLYNATINLTSGIYPLNKDAWKGILTDSQIEYLTKLYLQAPSENTITEINTEGDALAEKMKELKALVVKANDIMSNPNNDNNFNYVYSTPIEKTLFETSLKNINSYLENKNSLYKNATEISKFIADLQFAISKLNGNTEFKQSTIDWVNKLINLNQAQKDALKADINNQTTTKQVIEIRQTGLKLNDAMSNLKQLYTTYTSRKANKVYYRSTQEAKANFDKYKLEAEALFNNNSNLSLYQLETLTNALTNAYNKLVNDQIAQLKITTDAVLSQFTYLSDNIIQTFRDQILSQTDSEIINEIEYNARILNNKYQLLKQVITRIDHIKTTSIYRDSDQQYKDDLNQILNTLTSNDSIFKNDKGLSLSTTDVDLLINSLANASFNLNGNPQIHSLQYRGINYLQTLNLLNTNQRSIFYTLIRTESDPLKLSISNNGSLLVQANNVGSLMNSLNVALNLALINNKIPSSTNFRFSSNEAKTEFITTINKIQKLFNANFLTDIIDVNQLQSLLDSLNTSKDVLIEKAQANIQSVKDQAAKAQSILGANNIEAVKKVILNVNSFDEVKNIVAIVQSIVNKIVLLKEKIHQIYPNGIPNQEESNNIILSNKLLEIQNFITSLSNNNAFASYFSIINLDNSLKQLVASIQLIDQLNDPFKNTFISTIKNNNILSLIEKSIFINQILRVPNDLQETEKTAKLNEILAQAFERTKQIASLSIQDSNNSIYSSLSTAIVNFFVGEINKLSFNASMDQLTNINTILNQAKTINSNVFINKNIINNTELFSTNIKNHFFNLYNTIDITNISYDNLVIKVNELNQEVKTFESNLNELINTYNYRADTQYSSASESSLNSGSINNINGIVGTLAVPSDSSLNDVLTTSKSIVSNLKSISFETVNEAINKYLSFKNKILEGIKEDYKNYSWKIFEKDNNVFPLIATTNNNGNSSRYSGSIHPPTGNYLNNILPYQGGVQVDYNWFSSKYVDARKSEIEKLTNVEEIQDKALDNYGFIHGLAITPYYGIPTDNFSYGNSNNEYKEASNLFGDPYNISKSYAYLFNFLSNLFTYDNQTKENYPLYASNFHGTNPTVDPQVNPLTKDTWTFGNFDIANNNVYYGAQISKTGYNGILNMLKGSDSIFEYDDSTKQFNLKPNINSLSQVLDFTYKFAKYIIENKGFVSKIQDSYYNGLNNQLSKVKTDESGDNYSYNEELTFDNAKIYLPDTLFGDIPNYSNGIFNNNDWNRITNYATFMGFFTSGHHFEFPDLVNDSNKSIYIKNIDDIYKNTSLSNAQKLSLLAGFINIPYAGVASVKIGNNDSGGSDQVVWNVIDPQYAVINNKLYFVNKFNNLVGVGLGEKRDRYPNSFNGWQQYLQYWKENKTGNSPDSDKPIYRKLNLNDDSIYSKWKDFDFYFKNGLYNLDNLKIGLKNLKESIESSGTIDANYTFKNYGLGFYNTRLITPYFWLYKPKFLFGDNGFLSPDAFNNSSLTRYSDDLNSYKKPSGVSFATNALTIYKRSNKWKFDIYKEANILYEPEPQPRNNPYGNSDRTIYDVPPVKSIKDIAEILNRINGFVYKDPNSATASIEVVKPNSINNAMLDLLKEVFVKNVTINNSFLLKTIINQLNNAFDSSDKLFRTYADVLKTNKYIYADLDLKNNYDNLVGLNQPQNNLDNLTQYIKQLQTTIYNQIKAIVAKYANSNLVSDQDKANKEILDTFNAASNKITLLIEEINNAWSFLNGDKNYAIERINQSKFLTQNQKLAFIDSLSLVNSKNANANNVISDILDKALRSAKDNVVAQINNPNNIDYSFIPNNLKTLFKEELENDQTRVIGPIDEPIDILTTNYQNLANEIINSLNTVDNLNYIGDYKNVYKDQIRAINTNSISEFKKLATPIIDAATNLNTAFKGLNEKYSYALSPEITEIFNAATTAGQEEFKTVIDKVNQVLKTQDSSLPTVEAIETSKQEIQDAIEKLKRAKFLEDKNKAILRIGEMEHINNDLKTILINNIKDANDEKTFNNYLTYAININGSYGNLEEVEKLANIIKKTDAFKLADEDKKQLLNNILTNVNTLFLDKDKLGYNNDLPGVDKITDQLANAIAAINGDKELNNKKAEVLRFINSLKWVNDNQRRTFTLLIKAAQSVAMLDNESSLEPGLKQQARMVDDDMGVITQYLANLPTEYKQEPRITTKNYYWADNEPQNNYKNSLTTATNITNKVTGEANVDPNSVAMIKNNLINSKDNLDTSASSNIQEVNTNIRTLGHLSDEIKTKLLTFANAQQTIDQARIIVKAAMNLDTRYGDFSDLFKQATLKQTTKAYDDLDNAQKSQYQIVYAEASNFEQDFNTNASFDTTNDINASSSEIRLLNNKIRIILALVGAKNPLKKQAIERIAESNILTPDQKNNIINNISNLPDDSDTLASDVDNIVNNAFNQAQTNAKDKIATLPNLTPSQVGKFNEKIDRSPLEPTGGVGNSLEKIVNVANDINNDRTLANNAIDKANNLNDAQKDNLTKQAESIGIGTDGSIITNPEDTSGLDRAKNKALDIADNANALDKDMSDLKNKTFEITSPAFNNDLAKASEETKDIVAKARDNALNIINKAGPDASKEEVKDAIKQIDDAIAKVKDDLKTLNAGGTIQNRKDAAIDEINDLKNIAPEVKKQFTDAITNTQDPFVIAKNLKDAKTLDKDYGDLFKAITDANNAKETPNYKFASPEAKEALDNALAKTNNPSDPILNNDNLGIKDQPSIINPIVKDLENALNGLNGNNILKDAKKDALKELNNLNNLNNAQKADITKQINDANSIDELNNVDPNNPGIINKATTLNDKMADLDGYINKLGPEYTSNPITATAYSEASKEDKIAYDDALKAAKDLVDKQNGGAILDPNEVKKVQDDLTKAKDALDKSAFTNNPNVLNDIKEAAKNAINNLENLSDQDKDQLNKQIEASNDPEMINNVLNPAIDLDNNVKNLKDAIGNTDKLINSNKFQKASEAEKAKIQDDLTKAKDDLNNLLTNPDLTTADKINSSNDLINDDTNKLNDNVLEFKKNHPNITISPEIAKKLKDDAIARVEGSNILNPGQKDLIKEAINSLADDSELPDAIDDELNKALDTSKANANNIVDSVKDTVPNVNEDTLNKLKDEINKVNLPSKGVIDKEIDPLINNVDKVIKTAKDLKDQIDNDNNLSNKQKDDLKDQLNNDLANALDSNNVDDAVNNTKDKVNNVLNDINKAINRVVPAKYLSDLDKSNTINQLKDLPIDNNLTNNINDTLTTALDKAKAIVENDIDTGSDFNDYSASDKQTLKDKIKAVTLAPSGVITDPINNTIDSFNQGLDALKDLKNALDQDNNLTNDQKDAVINGTKDKINNVINPNATVNDNKNAIDQVIDQAKNAINTLKDVTKRIEPATYLDDNQKAKAIADINSIPINDQLVNNINKELTKVYDQAKDNAKDTLDKLTPSLTNLLPKDINAIKDQIDHSMVPNEGVIDQPLVNIIDKSKEINDLLNNVNKSLDDSSLDKATKDKIKNQVVNKLINNLNNPDINNQIDDIKQNLPKIIDGLKTLKDNVNKTINSIPTIDKNASDAAKDAFNQAKDKLDQALDNAKKVLDSKDLPDVKTIDNANNDLTKAKDDLDKTYAKTIIDQLDKLSPSLKQDFNNKIDAADNNDQIQNILKQAKDANDLYNDLFNAINKAKDAKKSNNFINASKDLKDKLNNDLESLYNKPLDLVDNDNLGINPDTSLINDQITKLNNDVKNLNGDQRLKDAIDNGLKVLDQLKHLNDKQKDYLEGEIKFSNDVDVINKATKDAKTLDDLMEKLAIVVADDDELIDSQSDYYIKAINKDQVDLNLPIAKEILLKDSAYNPDAQFIQDLIKKITLGAIKPDYSWLYLLILTTIGTMFYWVGALLSKLKRKKNK
ncbi:hypothetical protein GE118_01370 [Mycoplasma sp. NEAQ87857]|uniref:GA module-containing protein n=1 Tax=Mycoplasma sp. NEAQ87857 TaxID=2683967 RepID=UPI0013192549|nr:GA module-containing protein [Mycoplasma sp. NEAQ87857]QGZ97444.1 hypothetical protein GE118_01370 [Mycoplasma sp. NEAQ87857]